MKTISLKCPSCEANLELDASREVCFCQYCGEKMLLDSEEKKVTIVNITRDETEIEKARLNQIQEKENNNMTIKMVLILFALYFILMLFMHFTF